MLLHVSSCYDICVIILLYMCPHAAIYVHHTNIDVSSCSFTHVSSILLHVCPRTTIYMSSYYYIYVLILLCVCPHTTIYMSSYYYRCVLILLYTCVLDTTTCVLVLLYVCSYYCTRDLMQQLQQRGATAATAPLRQACRTTVCVHTTVHVTSYYYICVRILLHMCPDHKIHRWCGAV